MLTCIFIEPLQASFTRKHLLLSDLGCFMFSENAVKEKENFNHTTRAVHRLLYVYEWQNKLCTAHIQVH